MAKKTPAATDNAQDSAQKQSEAAIVPQAESAPQAGSTLPFAQKREELIKKFRANAVPREADYKQLLDQHYDVAGALGMANSEDNNGGNTGKGLVFESEKLHVKAKEKGGLLSDTNGVSLATGSSLVIGTDNKVNVNISGSNGLEIKTNGEVGIKLYSYNNEHIQRYTAVITNLKSGIFVHVGESGDKKGLKQYQGSSAYGAVLGVYHDDTLNISQNFGSLGVKLDPLGGLASSSSGLKINTIGTSGLKLEGNALKINAGKSLEIDTNNQINVKVSGTNGLKISSSGEVGINLLSNNVESVLSAAAVIVNNPANKSGLWINVGADGDKKGLKQYKSTSAHGAVLGVSHDDTLKINNTSGMLGVRLNATGTGIISSTTSGLNVSINTNKGLVSESKSLGVKLKPSGGLVHSSDGILVGGREKDDLINEMSISRGCEYYGYNSIVDNRDTFHAFLYYHNNWEKGNFYIEAYRPWSIEKGLTLFDIFLKTKVAYVKINSGKYYKAKFLDVDTFHLSCMVEFNYVNIFDGDKVTFSNNASLEDFVFYLKKTRR